MCYVLYVCMNIPSCEHLTLKTCEFLRQYCGPECTTKISFAGLGRSLQVAAGRRAFDWLVLGFNGGVSKGPHTCTYYLRRKVGVGGVFFLPNQEGSNRNVYMALKWPNWAEQGHPQKQYLLWAIKKQMLHEKASGTAYRGHQSASCGVV
jgi:hypothetical protein